MLASLLPGFRDARVPLASGLIWLAAIAIGGSWVLPLLAPSVLVEQIVAAATSAGTAVTLAAIAFAAYLVGVATQSASGSRIPHLSDTSRLGILQRVTSELDGARLRKASPRDLVRQLPELRKFTFEHFDEEEQHAMIDEFRSENPHDARSANQIFDHEQWLKMQSDDAAQILLKTVIEELKLAELSLQIKSKDVYDKYDRLRAEGEFRTAIVLPISLFVLAASLRLSIEYSNPVWLILIAGIGLIIPIGRSGARHLRDSSDLMVQAVLGKLATSPTLELLVEAKPSAS